MTLTMSQVLDAELPRCCGECGTELPERGAQCAACGWLPEVTRPELEETLSEPGRLARMEADRLMAEGRQFQQEAESRFLAGRRVLAAAAAEAERDTAQAALDAALTELGQAEAALEDADRVAVTAAAQLEEAVETHRRAALAEEGARRLREGPAAETDALARLNAATEVLARYQVPARETAELRQAAMAEGCCRRRERRRV